MGDYLDAEVYGLPSPVADTVTFVLERYGFGECASLERIFTKPFWDRMAKKILEEGVNFEAAKKSLNMVAQGPRLVRFYQSLDTRTEENFDTK